MGFSIKLISVEGQFEDSEVALCLLPMWARKSYLLYTQNKKEVSMKVILQPSNGHYKLK